MGRSRISAGLFMFAFILSAAQAHTAELPFGNSTITFIPPANLCLVDPAQGRFDQAALQWQSRMSEGKNVVVGMFIECDQLAKFRKGDTGQADYYGVLLTSLPNKANSRAPLGLSRQTLLDFTASQVGGRKLSPAEIEAEASNALSDEQKRAIGEAKVSRFRELGIMDRDEAAIYYGSLMSAHLGDESGITAGVGAITFINERMLQLSLYRTYTDKSVFSSLLKTQKKIMHDLVVDNDAISAAP